MIDALFAAVWGNGKDVQSKTVLHDALTGAGLDADTLLARAAEDDVKATLRRETEEALAQGVFGVPTFIARGELFSGSDRVADFERFLEGEESARSGARRERHCATLGHDPSRLAPLSLRETRMPSVAVRVHAKCQSCAHPVPFNALVMATPCPSCDAVYRVSGHDWSWVVEPAEGAKDTVLGLLEARKSRENAALEGNVFPGEPVCDACKKELDAEGLTTESGVPCSCGAKLHARRPPAFAASSGRKGWSFIVGEDPASLDEKVGAAPMPVAPIQFPCPSCAASLSVDGSTRAPTCRFCQARAFLPDALWRELRPPRLIRTWFLWIDRADWDKRKADSLAEEREKIALGDEERARDMTSAVRWRVAISGVVAALVVGLTAYFWSEGNSTGIAGTLAFGAQIWLFSGFEVLRASLERRDDDWWVLSGSPFRIGRLVATVVLGGALAGIGHFGGNEHLFLMAPGASVIGLFVAGLAYSMPEEMLW